MKEIIMEFERMRLPPVPLPKQRASILAGLGYEPEAADSFWAEGNDLDAVGFREAG